MKKIPFIVRQGDVCLERISKLPNNLTPIKRADSKVVLALGGGYGWGVRAVHGVRVPQYVIEHPEDITTEKIEGEQNAEVRRVMIERYGQDRYLLDSGAHKIHQDEFGVLYRKELADDEPIVMVKLLNSTAEPDGIISRDEALAEFSDHTAVCHDGMMMELNQVPASLRFKSYMLRVPPTTKRAKEAVAWLNHMTEEEYAPAYQS